VRRLQLPIQPQDDDPTTWEMFRYMMRNARTLDFKAMLGEYYHKILFERSVQVGQVFCLISDPANLPALVHCTAGKDRTGLVAALVQLLVDVPHEVVVNDYLLTNQLYAPRARTFNRLVRWISLFRVSNGQLRHLMEAHREYLEVALEQLFNTFGSVETYLQVACQVPEDNLQRLREMLTQPPASKK
jgi:protein-tyrosine phosphatase